MRRCWRGVGTWIGWGLVPALALAGGAPGDPLPLVDTGSTWRCYVTMRTPVVGSATTRPALLPDRAGRRFETPPPPAGWTQPDFDDHDWSRVSGPVFGAYGFNQQRELALLCLRGKFAVNNPVPAKDVGLSVTFRGGLVAYVNGTEVARQALPEGPITGETLADDYPWDTYVRPDGKVLKWGWGDPQTYKDRCELRIRRLENVIIPANLLRPGVNVLALEVHRAAIHPDSLTLAQWWNGTFSSVGVLSVRLTGAVGPSAAPSEESRLGVWTPGSVVAVFDGDHADPNERPQPIRLVGARRGAVSGQVVLSGEAPLTGLSAVMSDLRATDSGPAIPSSAVEVRYALAVGHRYQPGKHFDTLSPTPPAEAEASRVLPVWITVNVPEDVPAGEYHGRLTVTAADAPAAVEVPVELTVCPWTLPPPHNWVTFADFIESPESVALYYNVPLWSDRHFELIGRTFERLALVGNKTIYIPLISMTNLGNEETMVRWIPGKGAVTTRPTSQPARFPEDTAFTYDFSVVERYLDLYIEKVGAPRVVIFQVWDHFVGGGYFGRDSGKSQPIPVSCRDPATDAIRMMEGPRYHEAEAEGFWRPVADGLRERLAERGLEQAMMVGIASDVFPSKPIVELWRRLWPHARWVHQGHGLNAEFHGTKVGYATTVWRPRWATDPDTNRTYGWTNPQIVCHFDREASNPPFPLQVLVSRIAGERNIIGNQHGFGRMSADFWPCLKGGRAPGMRSISARFPISNWSQLNLSMTAYVAPGPEGALSTVRFENIREGMQECEARIAIEKALLDGDLRARLGDDLARRAQALLDERTRAVICATGELGGLWYPASGWQARRKRIFRMAAEVADALGTGEHMATREKAD